MATSKAEVYTAAGLTTAPYKLKWLQCGKDVCVLKGDVSCSTNSKKNHSINPHLLIEI